MAEKINELQLHAGTQLRLRNKMLNTKSESQKNMRFHFHKVQKCEKQEIFIFRNLSIWLNYL